MSTHDNVNDKFAQLHYAQGQMSVEATDVDPAWILLSENAQMISYEKFYDGKNAMYVYDKMVSYADGNKNNNTTALTAKADEWRVNINMPHVHAALYLTNFGAGRVSYHHDDNVYNYCISNKKTKTLKKYISVYQNEENTRLLNGSGEMYRPCLWGKATNIGEDSPVAWTMMLKAKHAFKSRRTGLLDVMRNDLRVFLKQQNFEVDTAAKYKLFINTIVNAFIPDQTDLYAHNLLSSNKILSGVEQFNKGVDGDFNLSTKLTSDKKLISRATNII